MPRLSLLAFIAILLISLTSVLHLFKGFVDAIIMALVVVSLFEPVHLVIAKKIKRDYFACLISTSLVFLIILIPSLLFLLSLTKQGLLLFKSSNQFTSSQDFLMTLESLKAKLYSLQNYLVEFDITISTQKIVNAITSITQYLASFFYDNLSMIASNVLSLGFNFILTIVLVFVFLKSGKSLKVYIMDFIPLPHTEQERMIKRFKELSSAVFLGNGFISVLEGLIGGLLVYFFDIQGALVWGFLMAILAFLPLIGAGGIVIPLGFYLYLSGRSLDAFIFLLLNFLQIFIMEMIVKPKIVSGKSNMHEVVVFLSIISAVKIYGMLGIFYGPLLVTMFLTLASIYREHYQKLLLNKEEIND